MKQETAELILDSAHEMFRQLGVDPREFIEKMNKHFFGRTTKSGIRIEEKTYRQCVNEDFLPILLKQPEPTQQRLAEILAKIKTFAPEMRRLLIEKAHSIHKGGAGGAPRLLSKNNAEARLCALVSEQRNQGEETPAAVRMAAKRFGVSYWTAKRAWNRYIEANRKPSSRPIRKQPRLKGNPLALRPNPR